MFQATTSSRAAIDAIGIYASRSATSSMAATMNRACTIEASGELPPARMLAAVRAMAAVAGMPPKNGTTMLPMPCPINSSSESCLPPDMPSATTAHSRDSNAPRMAMVKAGAASCLISSKLMPIGWPCASGSCHGRANAGNDDGMPAAWTPSIM